MIVTDNTEPSGTQLKDICPGDCFELEECIYIKTNEVGAFTGSVTCVRLSTGDLQLFNQHTEVLPRKAEVIVR